MRIIPAIDIIDGKCVRLTQGAYDSQKIYNEDPLEVARMFEGSGIQYLHVVDLDGARQKKIVNHRVLEKIATQTNLHIDFGGGVKSAESLDIAFNSGARQVTLGSIAAQDKELTLQWLQQYGAEKLILGADTKAGMIAVNGWQETSSLPVSEFIGDYLAAGFSTVICTDVQKDGMLQGPSIELYKDLLKQHDKLQLVASGGVGSIEDIEQLAELKVAGVIVGKAIYEDKISLKQLEPWL